MGGYLCCAIILSGHVHLTCMYLEGYLSFIAGVTLRVTLCDGGFEGPRFVTKYVEVNSKCRQALSLLHLAQLAPDLGFLEFKVMAKNENENNACIQLTISQPPAGLKEKGGVVNARNAGWSCYEKITLGQ